MLNENTYVLCAQELTLLYEVGPGILRTMVCDGAARRTVSFSGDDEFIAQVEHDRITEIVTSGACAQSCTVSPDRRILTLHFEQELFAADVRYGLEDGLIRKTVTLEAKQAMKLKCLIVENMRTMGCMTRGGEGQPVFIDNELFAGIEFPVCINDFCGDALNLVQHPYIQLKSRESYEAYPVVFGFRSDGTIEESFERYIARYRVSKKDGKRIYCDWGLHDELSDHIDLTEKMTLSMIDRLADLRSREIFKFDYYLVDAYWFEEGRPYLEFRKAAWPDGTAEIRRRLDALGMKLGLWFDVNMASAKISGYDGSRREAGLPEFCISDERSAELLQTALEYHVRNDHVKMIKFDFSYFDCKNSSHDFHAKGCPESKEPAVRAFLKILGGLRRIDPEIVFLAYNGFTTDLSWIGSVVKGHLGYAVSPWWAFFVDYIYCGDPRPSEIPSVGLESSIIYYTDAMVRQFRDSLMPFESIDDHGTIVGNTGTIYYLKEKTFRDSWIMNIARGSGKLHFYGDINLLDKDDLAFLGKSDEMFRDVCKPSWKTQAILGSPLNAEPYGYSSSNGIEGYITVVNPSSSGRFVDIALSEWKTGERRELTTCYAKKQFIGGNESVGLSQTFHAYAEAGSVTVYQWRNAVSRPQPRFPFDLEAGEKVTIPIPVQAKTVSLNFYDEKRLPLRSPNGLPDGCTVEWNGKSVRDVVGQTIWSNISWVMYDLNRDEEQEGIRMTISNSGTRLFYVKWEAQMA